MLLATPTPGAGGGADLTEASVLEWVPIVVSVLALGVSVLAAVFTYRRDRTSLTVRLSASIHWFDAQAPREGTSAPPTPVVRVDVELDSWGPQPPPEGLWTGHLEPVVHFKARIANTEHRPVTVFRWFVEFRDGTTRGVVVQGSAFEHKVRLEDGDPVEDEVLASSLLGGRTGERKIRAVAEAGNGKMYRSRWHRLPNNFPAIPPAT